MKLSLVLALVLAAVTVAPAHAGKENQMVDARQICEGFYKNIQFPERPDLNLGWSTLPEDIRESMLDNCIKRQFDASAEVVVDTDLDAD